MRFRPQAISGRPSHDDNGYDALSYQTLGIDGYYAEPVVAPWQQVGIYKLPLASVSNKNNGGILRHDGVENLNSEMNVDITGTIWGAPTRGAVVNQTGGMVNLPMSSYMAGQYQANPITVNADQASVLNRFMSSLSPRSNGIMALSTLGGD